MKYTRGNQKETIEQGVLGKMRLTVNGEDTENIWVKRLNTDKVAVLQNNALNLYPFPSWGAIIPSVGQTFDLKDIREKFEIELHPEAYDEMFKQGVIDEQGNFIQPVKESEEDE